MSDFKLPDLPSDDELGITDADREGYDDEPELTPEERRALGLEDAKPAAPPPGKAPPPPGGGKPPKKKKEPRPPEPTGPRSRWRGPVTLLVLAAAGWLSSSYRTLPAPVARQRARHRILVGAGHVHGRGDRGGRAPHGISGPCAGP